MSLSPLDSSSPAAAEVPLAPGFRFHPTDEELVSYYLRRRVLGRRLRVDAIAEIDLYRLEPWDLPSLSRIRSRDAQWYFFARLDRKLTGAGAGGRGGPGNRTNRATPRGYWKTTGKDREVYHRGKPAGMKKTLVFHAGRAPKGERTNWVMHEYRLLDADGPQDLHVVCRIFQKVGSGPMNGAQYGAPYMEEEWEEEDDAIENEPASGASAEVAALTDTADEESNEEDENGYCKTNELAQARKVLNPPEMPPLQAQGFEETSDGGYADGVISLEEILQEPLSTVSAENICTSEAQNAIDDNFSVADLSGYPRKDDGYVGQNGTMNWSDPANGDDTCWPLRAYSNQNYVNGTLSAEELFDTGNDNIGNAYSDQQQNCHQEYQNLDSQSDGFPAPQQVDGNMVFHDATSDHKWVDGNDDFVYLNDLLNEPLGNQSLFDGDDLMAYFDATENDFKYDILGPPENSNYQLTDMSNFAQKGDNKDKFTFDGISKASVAQYGASSSGSHEDLYPDTAVPDALMDDAADKTFGKRLANMLGSIPAPPAMASEFPPTTGKSVGPLSGANPSSIRVTAGIIQLGGLTFTGSSERCPLQKNGDLSLLLSFTMESDVSSKPVDFEQATQISTVPMVLRSGFYLFFVSAMILMLSYKIGSCIYSSNKFLDWRS
ncbi:NAC domain-containing protein 78-like [Phragmites australis]|uniref:NAC domain-containing protein 78-like n=1 Tax=Phragmites australis TaxID=29695 RepID=UPI002D7944CA|nr:NAC domain-containing protein 78-like [Phragmites australis]